MRKFKDYLLEASLANPANVGASSWNMVNRGLRGAGNAAMQLLPNAVGAIADGGMAVKDIYGMARRRQSISNILRQHMSLPDDQRQAGDPFDVDDGIIGPKSILNQNAQNAIIKAVESRVAQAVSSNQKLSPGFANEFIVHFIPTLQDGATGRSRVIELSNGHRFTWQCASGALGFDGLGYFWDYPLRWLGLIDPTKFTVVSKTITTQATKGNLSMLHPWTCVRALPGGDTVNAVGLTNPGVESWVKDYYPRAVRKGYQIAASIASTTWEDAFVLGSLLKPCDLAFIEVNVSCPNVGKLNPADKVNKVVCGLRMSNPRHPLVVKLSFGQTQDEELLESIAANPSIEAVYAINSVPWEVLHPTKTSPLQASLGEPGGVSGPSIHNLALAAVRNIARIVPGKPIIAGGGILGVDQILHFRQAGADAFSFGTLFLHRPWAPNRIMKKFPDGPNDWER